MKILKRLIILSIVLIIVAVITKIALDYASSKSNYFTIENKEENIEADKYPLYTLTSLETEEEKKPATWCTAIYLNYLKEKNIDALLSILDKQFIKENEITASNVIEKLAKYQSNIQLEDSSIYINRNTEKLAYLYICNMFETDTVNLIIRIDSERYTFSIIPCKEESQELYVTNTIKESITTNMYNKYIFKLYL